LTDAPRSCEADCWATSIRQCSAAVGARCERHFGADEQARRPTGPVQTPVANAFAERWVRTAREDCLDQLLVFSPRQVEGVLCRYLRHYNQAGPHRGLRLAVPAARRRAAAPGRSTAMTSSVASSSTNALALDEPRPLAAGTAARLKSANAKHVVDGMRGPVPMSAQQAGYCLARRSARACSGFWTVQHDNRCPTIGTIHVCRKLVDRLTNPRACCSVAREQEKYW
jgi:hypothetical protein